MSSELMGVLQPSLEELVSAATGRLADRPEFRHESSVVAVDIRRCFAALRRADELSDSAPLCEAILRVGRADTKPARGYRRAQLMLEAICAETVDQIHRSLPRDESRDATQRLRSLIGPAQVGLVDIFRPQSAGLTVV